MGKAVAVQAVLVLAGCVTLVFSDYDLALQGPRPPLPCLESFAACINIKCTSPGTPVYDVCGCVVRCDQPPPTCMKLCAQIDCPAPAVTVYDDCKCPIRCEKPQTCGKTCQKINCPRPFVTVYDDCKCPIRCEKPPVDPCANIKCRKLFCPNPATTVYDECKCPIQCGCQCDKVAFCPLPCVYGPYKEAESRHHNGKRTTPKPTQKVKKQQRPKERKP